MKKKIEKTMFLLTIVMTLFFTFDIVYATDCDGLLTQDAYDFIMEILGYIRIGVPILLIVLCSTDLVSVVTSQDDKAVKVATSRIVKRFIAAAAFFLVPFLISFVLSIDAIKNSLNLVDDPLCGIDTNIDASE